MARYTNSVQPKVKLNKKFKKRAKKQPLSFFQQLPFGGYDGLQGIRDLKSRVAKIADMINVEYKYRITDFTTGAINFNGTTPILLNAIAEGSGEDERNGLSIKCQNLSLNYHAGSTATGIVRVIVIWDKQDTISTINNLLNNLGSAAAPNSFYSQPYKFQKKVLYDRTHVLTAGGGLQQNVVENIKLDEHTNFADGSPTITTGAIKIFFVSDSAPVAPHSVVGYARLSYTDN